MLAMYVDVLTTTFLAEMKSENLQSFDNNYYKVASIFRPLPTPVFDCLQYASTEGQSWCRVDIGGSTQQNVSCFTSINSGCLEQIALLMLPANTLDSDPSHGWTLQAIWP